jgi:short-subunit dehydrogenase
MKNEIVLLTGASSGIGFETALLLQQSGYKVYAAARRTDRLKKLESQGISILSIDVTSDVSMQQAVQSIIDREGRIDVLINNAGYGSFGSLEEVPMEEARQQFEVNVFGLARLTQLVIPHMREKQYGKIVNIASVAAHIYQPLGSWYHSTKFAVEGLSDCLRVELKPFGIKVILVEPGPIKSEWSGIAVEHLLQSSGKGPYRFIAQRMATTMTRTYEASYVSGSDAVARVIAKSLKRNNPRARYTAGQGASFMIFARRMLGTRIFDALISKMMVGKKA